MAVDLYWAVYPRNIYNFCLVVLLPVKNMNVERNKRETTLSLWSLMMELFGVLLDFETIHGISCWYKIGPVFSCLLYISNT